MSKIKLFENKKVLITYIVCNVLTVFTIIGSIVTASLHGLKPKTFSHIGLCAIAIIFYNIPLLMRIKFKLHIPPFLQITVTIFAISHFIFGEILRAYDNSLVFDKLLHTASGVIFGVCGFSLVNGLNTADKPLFKLSPFFVAVFSFCFALTIGHLWELLEFAADSVFGANMQRWQDGFYTAAVNGAEQVVGDYGQGSGLIDSMGDMIVNMIGAAVISLIGFIWLNKKSKAIDNILIKSIPDL